MVLLKSFFVFFVVFVQSSLGAPLSRKRLDLPKAAYYERIGNSKVFVFKSSINSTVFSQIIGNDKSRKNDDSPFYTVNLGTLVSKFQEWQREMPRVKPFYSVKTNNEPVILSTLAALGSGFDCASKNEMNMILGNNKLTTPENIIFAHTIKPEKFISHADKMGINKMTFDNEEELYKVKKFHSNPRMVLRINVSDPTAAHKLGAKFGSNPVTDAPKLLKKAAELGLEVIGISFHIGSGATKEETYGIGIKYARDLFDKGLELGHNMTLLDIGGGYPGNDTDEEISLQKIAKVVNTALDKYFPESGNYEIIAEPGRYFATAPVSVTANIVSSVEIKAERITKKPTDSNITAYSYYLNDGVYGTFACKIADFCPTISSFPLFPKNNQTQYISAVWGPTCSDSDLIEEQTNLPHMEVGEWLYYPYMGAYSIVLATDFNGFERAKGYYCIDEKSLPCFCRKVPADPDYLSIELCNCRSLCDICLQQHHKSLCPKADPNHPFFSNYFSEQIKLLSLDYLIFKRFLELCNPIDKIKLSFCCKYLSKFLPIELKLRSFEYGSASSYLNCIGIGRAVINEREVLEAYKKDLYPNFPYFYVQDISITKSDLIFFAKSDPIYVNFTNCTYDGGLCFYDFIQNFPHVIGINISYNMLPKTWIKDFINTKRYILLRCIDVYSVGVFPDNIDLNELVELLKINRDLILTFYMGHNLNFSEAWKKIEKIMNHERFAVSSNKNRCSVEFIIGESRMMFSFNRIGL